MTLFDGLDLNAPDVKFLAGFLYARGLGVDRDLEKARVLLVEASRAGSLSAQFLLGWLMQSGRLSGQSSTEIVHWYTQAAEGGHATAAFNLADLYERGELVDADMGQAVKWYMRASELGSSTAAVHLGELYEEGKLIPRDERSALTWYQRSVSLGNVAGHMNLARVFRDGALGAAKDDAKATELEKLGERLRERRDAEELTFLREGALHGDRQSQEILAMVYQTGALGVNPDSEKANFWSKKAREIVVDL
jgi:TPR repeat protein